jgi:hypothetical protein
VRDRLREPIARLREALGVEDRSDDGGQQTVLVPAGVAELVAQE